MAVKQNWFFYSKTGADTRIRTGDLTLTKGALYQLSYISEIGCLAVTYFHMAAATLSSARVRFTSEFGMGSGGTTTLSPPGINLGLSAIANKLWKADVL